VVTFFISFGRASSLALVVFLLVGGGFVADIGSLCSIIMGATVVVAVSTVSAVTTANEWRHETRMMQTEGEMLQQSMRTSRNTFMLAIHELRQEVEQQSSSHEGEQQVLYTISPPPPPRQHYKPQTTIPY
jgi:flagellar motor component MotA